VLIDRATLARLLRARELLSTNDDAVASVARTAGVSPFHFIRLFAAAFGETPGQFRIKQRVERAKTLLADGASVTETCMEIGFASVGSFSGLFQRRVGVAPSAYRRVWQVRQHFAYAGCFSLMGLLPAGAFRNSGEAPRGGAGQARRA
jgi:AraC-like DNA-binding protein